MVLDTNALFLPVRRGFPLEAEIHRVVPGARLIVPSSARDELDRLATSGTRGAIAAREIAARYAVEPTDRPGDDGVLDVAGRLGAIVVTADRALQRRLVAAGIPILVPRDRHRLEPRAGRGPSPGRTPPVRRRRGNS
ncbi:MAG TPA: twitching motility protein PilT [Thermoplasmata archaeon]|nr:twitching motility protein PilT [Thermoplasmata archaeon]